MGFVVDIVKRDTFFLRISVFLVSNIPINLHNRNSYKTTNKMQQCRISLLFPCFLVALHVSSDVITHYQEHINCS